MKNLQSALFGNAVFSAISGLILAIFAHEIAQVFGFDESLAFRIIGFALLFFATTVWYEFKKMRPPFVKWIIAQDVLWVLGSIVLLVFKPLEISATGNILIALVAIIVAFMGWRQWVGLTRQYK